MIRRTRFLPSAVICFGLVWLNSAPAKNNKPKTWKAGVAKVIITPEEPILMAGYASRNKPSEGKLQDLYGKALALEDPSGRQMVLVTTDLIGLSRSLTEQIVQRVRQRTGLSRERLMLTSSHTHTGPVIRDSLTDMYDLKPPQVEVINRYTTSLSDRLVRLTEDALKALAPAKISYGKGQVDFAINRRQETPSGVRIGVNPEGPVDHSVPVLRVSRSDDTLLAILVGYACHNTTLTGEFYKLSGDYAGFAQDTLEQQHPGALALFVTGCGADANPNPRGTVELAERHGKALAEEVSRILKAPLQNIPPSLRARLEFIDLPLVVPSREEFQKRLQETDVYRQRHARRMLRMLEERKKIPAEYSYPVQVWQLGRELTLVALAGEVVVDYAIRLERELGVKTLWPIAYANDVFAYIPSARVLKEGGYEAFQSGIYYGMPGPFAEAVEDLIVAKVKTMSAKVQR
jgi:hypothetical protein